MGLCAPRLSFGSSKRLRLLQTPVLSVLSADLNSLLTHSMLRKNTKQCVRNDSKAMSPNSEFRRHSLGRQLTCVFMTDGWSRSRLIVCVGAIVFLSAMARSRACQSHLRHRTGRNKPRGRSPARLLFVAVNFWYAAHEIPGSQIRANSCRFEPQRSLVRRLPVDTCLLCGPPRAT